MFKLSEEGLKFVKKELKRYESPRSAIIPCLFRVQQENSGWISEEAIQYLAEVMDLPAVYINEVFHFYTMFNKQPVGKYHVQVCGNVSCFLNGGEELLGHLLKEHKTTAGKITSDGRFCFSKVECLGSCGTAPMMQVNEDYHENLNFDKALQVLRELK